ncbi:GNAT family N-acetyltransferase [Clostridium sp. ZBS15]|uniref:GNAT family N-acetyltransferase n=1 Tax=Clostridium sp. ZBS15 TaxID=2949969 RepID=UPI00207ADBA8|nr:GNAT family N-acetyltransferase [Clostridium sp. ZBS15]
MDYEIINMTKDYWNEVSKIYVQDIRTGIATFQTKIPSFEEWDKYHLNFGRLVAVSENEVLGWVALSPTSSRSVYSGVVEVSIYISEKHRKEGIGKALMTEVIKVSEAEGVWSFYSSIIRENIGSIKLHKNCGFRIIGIRERIAKLSNGKWSDTVLMEYRSKMVGID